MQLIQLYADIQLTSEQCFNFHTDTIIHNFQISEFS